MMENKNKNLEGRKFEVISFFRNEGEIGMHLNLKSEISPILMQDIFVCSSYENSVEYHYCDSGKLIIDVETVNNYGQIEKCVIAGNPKHIESFLIADGQATPDNPIDFKMVNFPDKLHQAISNFEIMIDEIKTKINDLA